ncbi:hypothetical protein LTR15_012915 [Elasticomyces elasticus]|nr:hypothetical protein LTR15_012915 [Elasticomyces elasticus]
MKGLDVSSAVGLLLDVSDIQEHDDQAMEQAQKIVTALGFHPLGITIAGSLIQGGRYSIQEYAVALETRTRLAQKDLLDKNNEQAKYTNISATFDVSAQALAASSETSSKDALALLDLLAFVHHQGVSEELFERAWQREETVIVEPSSKLISQLHTWHVTKCRQFLSSGSLDIRIHSLRKARAHLVRLSLVEFDTVTKSMSLHMLIYVWARERVLRPYESCLMAACILGLAVDGIPDPTPESTGDEVSVQRLFTTQIVPHLEANFSSFTGWPRLAILPSDREHLCRIWYGYTCQFVAASSPLKFECGQLVVKQILKLSAEGSMVEAILEVERLMIRVYQFERQSKSTFGPLKRVAITWVQLGKDNSPVMDVQDAFASPYLGLGLIDRFVALSRHVAKSRCEPRLKGKITWLWSEHHLAGAYLRYGQTKQAIELYERILRLQRDLLDHDDFGLISRHDLAHAYIENREVKKAIGLLEYVVDVRKRILEENHLEQLAPQHELAVLKAHLENGRIAQAITLLEHVHLVMTRLARDKPGRLLLVSQHELACAYLKDDQMTRGTEMLEHVVQAYENSLVDDHSEWLSSLHEITLAHPADPQVLRAMELLEHVVQIEGRLAGDPSDQLANQHVLAVAYWHSERHQEAVDLIMHVVRAQKLILNAYHPHRIQCELWQAYMEGFTQGVTLTYEEGFLQGYMQGWMEVLQNDEYAELSKQIADEHGHGRSDEESESDADEEDSSDEEVHGSGSSLRQGSSRLSTHFNGLFTR